MTEDMTEDCASDSWCVETLVLQSFQRTSVDEVVIHPATSSL